MTNVSPDPATGLSEFEVRSLEENLLKGAMSRTSLLCFIYALTFAAYGITSFPSIHDFDPKLTLFNNIWPRLVFNTIPFVALGLFFRSSAKPHLKAWLWVLGLPIIFVSACMIHVWPIIWAGRPELYPYVHAANIFIIATSLIAVSLPPLLLFSQLVAFCALFMLPLSYLLIRGHEMHLLSTAMGDFIICYVVSASLSYVIYNLRRKFARLDLYTRKVTNKNRAALEDELRERQRTIQSLVEERVKVKEDELTFRLASQVAHDIRSPLSALNLISSTLRNIPEEKRLIVRSATQRINDIANSLLKAGHSGVGNISDSDRVVMPAELVRLVVGEKRVQYETRSAIRIQCDDFQGYGLFTILDSTEFCRIISNLINNSVEAMSSGGEIIVGIRQDQNMVVVEIKDQGCGIEPDILRQVGERGFSHGKSNGESGAGLGLYHARKTVEAIGGRVSIQSSLGEGTTVTLALPMAKPPNWHVDSIKILSGQTVISVDDDPAIHQIWSSRIQSSIGNSQVRNLVQFTSAGSFISWMEKRGINGSLFLVDYEFTGETLTGLDLIKKLNIAESSILVTARYNEPHIRQLAGTLGIKIISKSFIHAVPLVVVETNSPL